MQDLLFITENNVFQILSRLIVGKVNFYLTVNFGNSWVYNIPTDQTQN